ncbi:MAG: hypothetical protein M5U31_01230 [Acidimicrobiia bacterium]|nr:hypothetical protein [Acidimicrobiia bacterium]
MRRLILVAVVAGLLVAGVLASPESPERGVLDSAGLRLDAAAAAGSNRAGVIIDDGSSVRRVCIRFNGTLTGVEALQRAASATVAPFGGLGVAVCGINGVGCPGDNSCLTCQQPKFWSYSRAPSGSTSFSVASSGASGSTVRDGDVEGWRWGGGKPAHVSAAKICGEAAAPPPVSASPPPVERGKWRRWGRRSRARGTGIRRWLRNRLDDGRVGIHGSGRSGRTGHERHGRRDGGTFRVGRRDHDDGRGPDV